MNSTARLHYLHVLTKTRSPSEPSAFLLSIQLSLGARKEESESMWYLNDKRAITDRCGDATVFTLNSIGQLSTPSGFFSTDSGVLSQVFAPNPLIGDISTSFSLPNNVLTWLYPTFTNGAASFCRTNDGTLYAVFQGPNPADCKTAILTALSPSGKSGQA